MSHPDTAPLPRQYWITLIVRAAIALVPGVAVTFIPDHSAGTGLIVFGAWATVSGVILGALALRTMTGTDRVLFAVSAIVTAASGLIALSVPGAGLALYLYLVSVWAAVTGFVELYAGLRERSRAARAGAASAIARDWIVAGSFTAVFAIAYLLLPPNDVVAVGLLGAYLVVIAVYLGIAGLSLRWDAARGASPRSEEVA